MGTVHGPVVTPAFQARGIRLNITSSRTVPSLMSPTTGTTFERGGKSFRLEFSTQPHYFSSLEKWLKLVFDGDRQGNVVHSYTGCYIRVTEIDYGIVCL